MQQGTDQDRIVELEAKAALADDLLDELNRTVFRQQQQIEQLAREVVALRERMLELADAGPRRPDAADEVPPHY